MEWDWRGNTGDDKAGILTLKFSAGTASVELPDFRDANFLAKLIEKELLAAEKRGALTVIRKLKILGEEITHGA